MEDGRCCAFGVLRGIGLNDIMHHAKKCLDLPYPVRTIVCLVFVPFFAVCEPKKKIKMDIIKTGCRILYILQSGFMDISEHSFSLPYGA